MTICPLNLEQHHLVLIRAYELFTHALQRLHLAMQLQDTNRRNAEIDAARGMLFEALADYANPYLLEETCAAERLHRLECSWAIDQTIANTYQVQNETVAVNDYLSHLQSKICRDILNTINSCETEDELDFLFPEITRICNRDLAVLNSWQNQPEPIHLLKHQGFVRRVGEWLPGDRSAVHAPDAFQGFSCHFQDGGAEVACNAIVRLRSLKSSIQESLIKYWYDGKRSG